MDKKVLNTDVTITYQKIGNIKTCVSPFEGDVTFKQLPKSKK